MANIILPKRWTMKPPVGTQINWGHPLTAGLKICSFYGDAGNVVNLAAANNPGVASTTGITQQNSRVGWASKFDGVAGQYVYLTANYVKSSWEMFVIPTGVVSKAITETREFGSNADWESNTWIDVNSKYSFRFYDNVGFPVVTSTTTAVSGVGVHLAITYDGATISLYVNGILENTTACAARYIYTAPQIVVGRSYADVTGTAGWADCQILLYKNWDRVLSPSEVLQLYTDPYCFMQPQQPARRYFIPPPSLTAMLTRLTPRKWSMKPPIGTQINWGHPLAAAIHRAWIFNEGAGLSCTDLVFGDIATANRINADHHYNNGNLGTEFRQGAGGPGFNTTRTSGMSSNPVTVASGFRIGTPNGFLASTPSNTGGGYIYSCRDVSADISPTLAYDSSNLLFFASSAGLADGAKSASTLVANVNYDAAGTYTGGVGGTWQTYLNGLKDGSANSYVISGSFGGTFTDTPEHLAYENGGAPSDMFFRYVYIWKRVLSPAEIMQIKQDPYCFMQVAPRIRLGSTTASSSLITVTAVYKFLQEALLTASLIGKSEQEATSIISKAWASAHEALATLSQARLSAHEAGIIAKNILLHVQEALQTASQQRLSSQEASGTVTRAVSHVQEALSKLANTYTAQQESLLSASKVYTSEQEALKGLQQAVSSLQEASGTVKRIVTSEQEAIAYTKTVNLSYQESLSSLSKVYTAVHEALKTASLVGSGFQEAKGIVTVLLSSIQEAKAYITTVSLGEQETLKPVSVQLNSVQEALKGLSKTLAASQEALGGVKKTTTHSQEAQAILVLSALLVEAARVVLTLLLEQTSATPTLEFEMTQEEV